MAYKYKLPRKYSIGLYCNGGEIVTAYLYSAPASKKYDWMIKSECRWNYYNNVLNCYEGRTNPLLDAIVMFKIQFVLDGFKNLGLKDVRSWSKTEEIDSPIA